MILLHMLIPGSQGRLQHIPSLYLKLEVLWYQLTSQESLCVPYLIQQINYSNKGYQFFFIAHSVPDIPHTTFRSNGIPGKSLPKYCSMLTLHKRLSYSQLGTLNQILTTDAKKVGGRCYDLDQFYSTSLFISIPFGTRNLLLNPLFRLCRDIMILRSTNSRLEHVSRSW